MAKLCIWMATVLVGMLFIAHSNVKCAVPRNGKEILCVNGDSDDISLPRCPPLEPEGQEDAVDVVEYKKREDKSSGDSDESVQEVCTQMGKNIFFWFSNSLFPHFLVRYGTS